MGHWIPRGCKLQLKKWPPICNSAVQVILVFETCGAAEVAKFRKENGFADHAWHIVKKGGGLGIMGGSTNTLKIEVKRCCPFRGALKPMK